MGGPSHVYCAGEDVAASSPSQPFASQLLWGLRPPDQGPQGRGLSRRPRALCQTSSLRVCAVCAAPEAAPEEPQLPHGARASKWLTVRMEFGFLSVTSCAGVALNTPPPGPWMCLCTRVSCTRRASGA